MDILDKYKPLATLYTRYINSNWQGVRFLCYHRVIEKDIFKENNVNILAVTADVFEKQMQLISDLGMTVVSMKQALSLLQNGEANKGNYICITFDDGYLDNVTIAWPILKKFGYAAHIFVVTDWIGQMKHRTAQGAKLSCQFVSKKDLQLFVREGGSVGSHSISHKAMTTLGTQELLKEIRDSKHALQQIIGQSVDTFAYPYAFFNNHMHRILADSGYAAAFIIELGSINSINNKQRYRIRRTAISHNEKQDIFALKIKGGYDWIRYYSRIKQLMRNYM